MFLKETFKILGPIDKLVDMTQFERTVKSGLIIRCLSIQAALGNRGNRLNRDLPSKLAILALNLRHIWVALSLGASYHATGSHNDSGPWFSSPRSW